MIENVLKTYEIGDFAFVSFQHLNILEVRSKQRIPQNCKCAIAIIFPYYNKNAFKGNISAYCSVADYHDVVGMRLKSICEDLKRLYPQEEFVSFTDASPIDEVDMCVKGGLGVRGQNSLLINKKYGSFVFIGEILTTLDLECVLFPPKSCINCGACIKACPGGAIENGKINKSRCASFISQKKGTLTDAEIEILSKAHTVFGCDICQRVCPYNGALAESENLFSKDIISTVNSENVESLYKQRAFGFRGLQVLKRNLEIYNKGK